MCVCPKLHCVAPNRCWAFYVCNSRSVAYARVYWPHTSCQSQCQRDKIIATALAQCWPHPLVCRCYTVADCQVSTVLSQIGNNAWVEIEMIWISFCFCLINWQTRQRPNLNRRCKFWCKGREGRVQGWQRADKMSWVPLHWRLKVENWTFQVIWQIIDMDWTFFCSSRFSRANQIGIDRGLYLGGPTKCKLLENLQLPIMGLTLKIESWKLDIFKSPGKKMDKSDRGASGPKSKRKVTTREPLAANHATAAAAEKSAKQLKLSNRKLLSYLWQSIYCFFSTVYNLEEKHSTFILYDFLLLLS